MNGRERIRAILAHETPDDHIGMMDAYWPSTPTRWYNEGLPAGVDPLDYFDMDIRRIGLDNSFQLPPRTIEETPEHVIASNGWGMVTKNWPDITSTPMLLDFAVKSRQDWDRLKTRLEPDDSRVDWDKALADYARWRKEGRFISFSVIPGYEGMWRKVGPEAALTAMLTDPDWVVEMYDYDTNLVIEMCERMRRRGLDFDGAWVYEDLGYRNALLFSPRTYVQQLMPFHKRMNDYFHSHDMPVIIHSCGCVREIIPRLIEVGYDCLQPLEAKAGMDVRELKREFGDRMSFMGNIDVRIISGQGDDPGKLEEEVREKVTAAKQGGGYVYHSDHSVPPSVSLGRYVELMELVRKYGGYD